jgi:GNAT superfamily N-acetyltransferase
MRSYRGPAALWPDANGDVVAFGWSELPGHLELFVDPYHSSLITQVLVWFDDVTTADQRTVSTVDTNQAVIDALTGAGDEVDDAAPFFRQGSRSLELPMQVAALPAGLTARTVTRDDRAEAALIHRAAFTPSRVTEASYRNVHPAWPYRHDLDWAVEAPNGRFVASVLIWFDEHNRVGQLEPVATAPEYRRRGLARAVCATAMNALRDLGFVARLRSLTFRRPGANSG